METLEQNMTEQDNSDKMWQFDDSTAVSQDVLSRLFGITTRRIRQLAGQGALTKTKPGHYAWPKVVADYIGFLRGGGESRDATLRQRELELKCKRLEQTIAEYDHARRDDVEQECWQKVQDCLAEYKSELERIPFDQSQMDTLNEALRTSIDRIRHVSTASGLSVAEAEVGPDSVD